MPSRLPMPPRGGSRPLPPAPAEDHADAPPPLPSRPAPSRPGGGHKPPMPRQNGRAMPQQRNVHQQPPSSDSNSSGESSDDDANYEEPEEQQQPSRPLRPAAPPSPEPAEGEIYDELEGTEPAMNAGGQSHLIQEETYDACQFEQPTQEPEEEFYTDAEEMPAPPDLDGDSGLYEFEPDNASSTPSPPPPPAPSSLPKRPVPPPPGPSQPPLPNRPVARHDSDESPDKKTFIKKVSGEGGMALGISLADLNLNRLKKVEQPAKTTERPEKNYDIEDAGTENESSIQARINRFKQKAEGTKPNIPTKPNFQTALTPPTSKPEPPKPAVAQDPLPPPPPSQVQQQFIDDDIYDEAMSVQVDPLNGNEWFHGKISRTVAEQRLADIGQDGTFLVRNSTKDDPKQPYTLVVLYKRHNFNLVVRVRADSKVALGSEKPDELAFGSVFELIDYHRNSPVILVNKQLGQQETELKKHPVNLSR